MWSVVRSDELGIQAEFERYCRSTTAPEEAPLTVAEAAQRWANHIGDPFAAWVVSPLAEYAGGADLLLEAADDWLDLYKRWLEKSRYAPESQRKLLRYASTVFKYAVNRKWLSRAPAPANFPAIDPEPKAYTRDELAAVYRSLRNTRTRHILPMLRLMLATGLRMSEVRTLRWDSVRLADNVIVLPWHAHKGGKRTKQGRALPLLPAARRILERQRGNHRTYVFVAKRTGKPYQSRHGLNSILYRGPTESDPSRIAITPHRLKHTFAQRAIDAGIAPHVVSEMLGQKDSRVVWVYAKIRDETLRAAFAQAAARAIVRPAGQSPQGKAVSPPAKAGRTSSTRKTRQRSRGRNDRSSTHSA